MEKTITITCKKPIACTFFKDAVSKVKRDNLLIPYLANLQGSEISGKGYVRAKLFSVRKICRQAVLQQEQISKPKIVKFKQFFRDGLP